MESTKNKMKVEIWSDVMCPFCYIGKRKFESALKDFDNSSNIEIIWKSFQLAPDMKTDPSKNIDQYLATHKGMSLEQAKGLNKQVSNTAAQVGLEFNFDKAIVANSFNAHRFSHLAKQHGLQNEAEERLFAAYFTEGKNTDDIPTLIQIGNEIGLDSNEVKELLEGNKYAEEVKADIFEAHQIGVRGVPFFVFDRKYAVSGAQESQAFLSTLEKSFGEWKNESTQSFEIAEGQSCSTDGDCN
ncbi:MAG: DsbA family oxidoreductase [Bacteroidia bacterium]